MYIVVLITCANKKEADNIALRLIRDKLAACVNIADKIKSVFWWKNKVAQADEVLLIAKSKKPKLAKIIKLVKSLHSYLVPEIIALPMVGGYKPYLKWIDESVR